MRINYLYNLCDLYVISSKSEGGPKQVLESCLTRTLVFSTRVSLAQDMLHPCLLYDENDIETVVERILKYLSNPEEFEIFVEHNYRNAQREMDRDLLIDKYKAIVLENI